MKKLAILSLILLTACVTDAVPETPEPSETRTTTASSITETVPETTTVSETTEPYIPPIEINMTDDEVRELAVKRSNELHELFMNFLQCDEGKLIFPFEYGKNTVYPVPYLFEDGSEEIFLAFYIAIHDEIKTYDDLYSLFCKTCTPDYSTKLLKFTSIQYTDFEGKLCFYETELCPGPEVTTGVEYNSYEVEGDRIKLNFTAHLYYDDGDIYIESDHEYSIYLKEIDGEWLVSCCTNIYFYEYEFQKGEGNQ